MDFAITPNQTITLELVPNTGEYSDRMRVNLDRFPDDKAGVYVIRFVDRTFHRLRGESSILKIGSARFDHTLIFAVCTF